MEVVTSSGVGDCRRADHVERWVASRGSVWDVFALRWLLDISGERLSVQVERGEGGRLKFKSCQFVQKAETSQETGSTQPGLHVYKREHLSTRPESLHV